MTTSHSTQESIERLITDLDGPIGALAALGEPRWFERGERIVVEGEPGDEVYVLLSGKVRAFSGDATEREITYCIDAAGDYFGEMTLDGGPRSATVEALEPSICAMLTRRTVLQRVRDDPDFAVAVLMKVIGRAREATERSRRLALMDVYGRLVKALHELARPADISNGALTTTEPITHQTLASRIGASREMVSRLMKDLERGGYVRTYERRISVLKPLPARW